MLTEVSRLDAIFSLFRSGSELSRLNREGSISGVSRDFVTVMEAGRAMGLASDGAFDPDGAAAVGCLFPAFRLSAGQFGWAGRDRTGSRAANWSDIIASTLAADQWHSRPRECRRRSTASPRATSPTRIADLLRNEGFEHVVVELGETRVLGDHPDGRPWRVGLRDQDGNTDRMIELVDGAMAMSGGYGTVFDPSGRNHHLFDPATGRSADRLLDVVISAQRATDADALATAIFVAGETRAASILANYAGASAILTRHDGTAIRI